MAEVDEVFDVPMVEEEIKGVLALAGFVDLEFTAGDATAEYDTDDEDLEVVEAVAAEAVVATGRAAAGVDDDTDCEELESCAAR